MSTQTVRDRTQEFFHLASSFRQPQNHASLDAGRKVTPTRNDTASQFNASASAVRQAMNLLSSNLDRLQILCNKQSLFSDLDRNINELAQFVKQELSMLSGQISQLEDFLVMENHHRLPPSEHFASSASKIMTHLKSEMVQLTKRLQDCLLARQRNIKAQRLRR